MSSALSSPSSSCLSASEQSSNYARHKTAQTRQQKTLVQASLQVRVIKDQRVLKEKQEISLLPAPIRRFAACRKGIALPLKIIVLLVISIITVIFAVMLFAKLWNAFIGADTIQQDVETVSAIIEKMAQTESTYEQQYFLLQLEDNYVLGFDETPVTFAGETYVRPAQCKGKPCLCKYDSKMRLQSCAIVDADAKINFYADYGGYAQNIFTDRINEKHPTGRAYYEEPRKLSATLFSTESDHAYKHLVLSTKQVQYLQEAGTPSEKLDVGAILPIVIEKIVVGDTIYLTIMPDSARARTRAYYGQTCAPATNSNDGGCAGQTGYTSYLQSPAKKYCAISILDGSCAARTMPQCVEGVSIRSPCLCGTSNEPMLYGYCVQGQKLLFSCRSIQSCDDYCMRDGSTPEGKTTQDHCTDAETVICNSNPCKLTEDCTQRNNDQIIVCREKED
jgi:hypothetical protein